MKNQLESIKWATDLLVSKGYALTNSPETFVEAPWSTVIRISTATEIFYLKLTPPLLFLEPQVMQLLKDQMQASVPDVVGSNNELCCFLMKDAGQTLRSYLKNTAQYELLSRAIAEFTTMQRSTENHLDSFFKIGVPDWRMNKLPGEYKQLISQTELLKAEGMTDEEVQILQDLIPTFTRQCELVSRYPIPETLVQPDFNTNNIMFNLNFKKMAFIDLGEIVISHPFFSLINFNYQATLHHSVKEGDNELLESCCKNWLDIGSKKQLFETYSHVKKLWPIYGALGFYRLMVSVDAKALKVYCANKPQLVGHLREYIATF